jgi:diguanylate cyclase
MKLFNHSNTAPEETKELTLSDELIRDKADVFHRVTLAMLTFLEAFALKDPEIQTDRFQEILDELRKNFNSSERPKHQELHFEHEKSNILKFIERQNAYLGDRDKALRDIIDLLTKAMANLNVENRDFYQRVYDESEKIIEITRLDDIKKIKNALKQEVDQMREVVDLKRDQENRRMQLLAGQVDVLREELEKAKEKSITDGLTGIYNRAAFDDQLAQKVDTYRSTKENFSLLMLDLDDFKSINDKYGHPLGDRVLVAFAQKCRSAIRNDDFLARYGGEEFAIILTGASLGNAVKKARLICQTIASTRYATNNSSQSNDYLSITVSIGVCATKKGDTVEKLLARADKALYEAKRSGKNRAVARK